MTSFTFVFIKQLQAITNIDFFMTYDEDLVNSLTNVKENDDILLRKMR